MQRQVQHLVALARGDGVLAFAHNRAIAADQVVVSFVTVLGPRAGTLSTQQIQGSLSASNELTQVFPRATPAVLLAHHEDALRTLAQSGVRPSIVDDDDDVVDLIEWRLWNAGAHYPAGLGATWRLVRKTFGRVEDLGGIEDHADTPVKIARVAARC